MYRLTVSVYNKTPPYQMICGGDTFMSDSLL